MLYTREARDCHNLLLRLLERASPQLTVAVGAPAHDLAIGTQSTRGRVRSDDLDGIGDAVDHLHLAVHQIVWNVDVDVAELVLPCAAHLTARVDDALGSG